MTTPNQQRTLRQIAHLTETIATNYRRWHHHWTTNTPDGYPTRTGNPGNTGNIADPTGNTAIQRQHTTDLLDQIRRDITTAHQTLERAAALIAATTPPADITNTKRAARCSGAIDPTCTNLADGRRHKSGLCDRCWQIDYRNKRHQ
jgi:hypothetical protein